LGRILERETAWLPQTKFSPPLLRDDFVPRRRLFEALRSAAGSHALTLISAPAGYGKTTLLASFSDRPVAWISLDEGDNDLALFFHSLVLALQRLNPEFGTEARAILHQIGSLAYTEAQTLYVEGTTAALRGDPGKTEELWTSALPEVERTPSLRPYLVAVLYFIGRTQWMQGRLDEARQAEARIAEIADPQEYPESAVARRLMRALAIPFGWIIAYCTGDCVLRAGLFFNIGNWLNLIFGLLAAVALGVHLRRRKAAG
jgi:ATP/maltotriose-dependent transcriptional regulator MalT